MGNVSTRLNAGDTGFALVSNAIAQGVVKEVQIDEKVDATSIVYQCDMKDGTTAAFPEPQIFPTPEDCASDLLARYYEANPPAQSNAGTDSNTDAAPSTPPTINGDLASQPAANV